MGSDCETGKARAKVRSAEENHNRKVSGVWQRPNKRAWREMKLININKRDEGISEKVGSRNKMAL